MNLAAIANLPMLLALAGAAAATAANPHGNHLLHLFLSFGVVGLFFVSIVDSSFVPLPIPGVTDIMLVLFAAQHTNAFLLVAIATVGSGLGGFFSYQVGHAGGLKFLESHVPKRIFCRVTSWMEHHAILAVALPAVLPPPMPLSPFVLAAGALKMSRRRFLSTFIVSRALRHILAVWLGVHYGPAVLRLWGHISARWGTTILIVLWSGILIGIAFAFWKLYTTSRKVRRDARSGAASNQPKEAAAS